VQKELRDWHAAPMIDVGSDQLIIYNGPLPTLDVFKLAMLNTKFHKLITKILAPLKLSHFKKYYETLRCVEMFEKTPSLERYKTDRNPDVALNALNVNMISSMLAGLNSPTFGGSVLGPVDGRQNLMYETIMRSRGTHGGLYKLYNVKDGDTIFDMDILIDWCYTTQLSSFKKVEQWHQVCTKTSNHGATIEFKDIKSNLTGFARVVALNNGQIISVTEGKMLRG
jgi:hypothetical protein